MLIKNCFALILLDFQNIIKIKFISVKARVGPISSMVVGAFYQMYFFFQVGGPLTAGLISGRGAYWRGAGWAYYRMYFFPGRWAYKFGAYEWQFMVIYVVV